MGRYPPTHQEWHTLTLRRQANLQIFAFAKSAPEACRLETFLMKQPHLCQGVRVVQRQVTDFHRKPAPKMFEELPVRLEGLVFGQAHNQNRAAASQLSRRLSIHHQTIQKIYAIEALALSN